MLEDGRVDLLDYIGTAPSLREDTLLDWIMGMAVKGKYGRIVWDTAPAGETLKLLDMPLLMKQHLRAGARVYEAVDRLTGMVSQRRTLAGIMEEWVVRSEGIAKFLKENTLFFIVANPEALVVNQAERVMSSLREADFEVRGLIINRVAVKDGYGFLAGMHARQQPYIQQLMNLANGLPVAEVPLTLQEIHGITPLRDLGEILFEGLGLSNREPVGGHCQVSD
jgi:arsenite-transporting ATPase